MILPMIGGETRLPRFCWISARASNIAYLSATRIDVPTLRLQYRLMEAINLQEDSVTFYHLCRSCEKGVERIGVEKEVDKQSYIV